MSKQVELENPDLKQQINFIGKLDENNATISFVIEKSKERTSEVLQNIVILVWFV